MLRTPIGKDAIGGMDIPADADCALQTACAAA